ncbi:phage tail protein [Ligilactobacillus saerimneri]|uniref:Tape measure protein N-terminal domain-containing protein n=1 Tax=Ligilactobacillus saerimneri 30a TaxID=1227363 RepID=M5J4P4_9LACO|nr:tape measure protein [Ligilactobacillus saerimneri]EKW99378.1 hypothetical protein D271_02324 [Ligilactobacillus saerimneri 30a]
MAQSFSVKAILQAVDSNFTSTMNRAMGTLGKLGSTSNNTSNSVGKSNHSMMGTFKSVAGAMGLVQVASKAFDVVKNSVGAAVNRIDTLNNSNRTFANMGFSANQTKSAMNGLQTSIKGLPTPLDQAVKGVQMVAASTGNLGKSQKVWSALNDAIIGFGGSTADVTNATIQLSQAFANGKIDGQTWISMMNSGMGPALNAIAKQMGITTGQLKEGLSSGKISTNQFMDALVNLDKNGGGGLKSLHKIAMDSTAGIGTSMENAKTAITRGVATAVQSFSSFAEKVTGMNLAEIISSIGDKAEQALKGIGPVLDDIEPAVKTVYDALKGLFDLVSQHADFLGPMAVGVLAFIGAFKGINAAITSLQTLIGVVGNFKAFVQIVMGAENSLMALFELLAINPWVALIAGIVAVIAALVVFFTKTKTGQKIWQAFTDFLKNAWNGLVSIAQSVWNSISNVFTTVVEVIKGVWNGIAEFFSNLWQGIVSVTTSIWNSFVNTMSPIIEAIKNLWNALKEFFATLWQGIVSVATPIWNILVTVITTVWNTIKSVVQTAITVISTVIQTVMTTIQTIWSTIWNAIVTVATTIWNVIKTAIQAAITNVSTIIQTTLTVIQTIWSTIWNVIVTVVTTIWNVIKTVIATAINAVAGVIRAVTQVIKGNWSAAWNAIKDVAQTVWNGIKSVVTTVINAVKSVINSVMNAIRSVMTSIWNGIKSVTSSVWNGIKSVVTSVVNGIKGTVSSVMNGIKSVFSLGWNTVKSVTSNGIHGAANVVRSVASGMASAGRNFVMGFVRGITGAIGSAVRAAANMARRALNAAKAALGIHSPSRVMRDEVGYYVTEGMAVGILGNIKSVSHAIGKVADASVINVPRPDTSQFVNTMNSLRSMNGQLASGSYSAAMTGELNLRNQPAYINLNLGGTDYSTFISDISRAQGVDAEFKRKYRF